ncbi:MAG: hypothetical protein R3B69_04335 [Candidatus Paceibacterota bacterium]
MFETVADDQFRISYDATRYTDFQVDSVGDLIIDAQGGDVRLNDENLHVCSGGACPSGIPAGTGNAIIENDLWAWPAAGLQLLVRRRQRSRETSSFSVSLT